MKKAKNAFAIIGIVFAVIAAGLLLLIPVIAGMGLVENPTLPPISFKEYFDLVLGRIPELFNFGWISSFSIDALKVNFPIIVAAVGIILLIVLFVLMICKKHAKGLGLWVPMLVVFGLSIVVASVYVKPDSFYNQYAKICDGKYMMIQLAGDLTVEYVLCLAGLICSIVAAASIILASIFYIVYVCKARKNAKKVDSAREAALAKIESLLGGNN